MLRAEIIKRLLSIATCILRNNETIYYMNITMIVVPHDSAINSHV